MITKRLLDKMYPLKKGYRFRVTEQPSGLLTIEVVRRPWPFTKQVNAATVDTAWVRHEQVLGIAALVSKDYRREEI